MKKILSLLAFLISHQLLCGQTLTGNWYGTLQLPGGNHLAVVFHVNKSGSAYKATMDSPDQGASGLPIDSTVIIADKITMTAQKFQIKYTGTYFPDSNMIKGIFTQGPANLPLNLYAQPKNLAVKEVVKIRPQDPREYPYKREEVKFFNSKAGDQLAGTLTLPSSGKANKIVILISGSGPQNRDEEIKQFNHRPFLVWSDWLTRNGIAVLRYDDRGVGASTGKFSTATSADFADDAAAAIDFIKSRADLKNMSLGLMGHSEGGMIAPLLASRDNRVKFIVLLAGPGIPIRNLMVQQSTDQMRLSGAPEAAILRSATTNEKVYNFIAGHSNLQNDELNVQIDTLLHQELRTYPAAELQGQSIDALSRQTASQISSSWFRYFITFNPADHLSKVKCPVLALNGTLDMQVRSQPNLAGIKTALQKAKNNNVKIMPLEGLNHLFQSAKTGNVSEYAEIPETASPLALKTVSVWINSL